MESPAKKRRTNRTEKSKTYFKFISAENGIHIWECTLCDKRVNGTKSSNLTSHLKSHPDAYSDVCSEKSSIEHARLKLLLNCVELVTVNGRAFRCLNDSAIHKMNEDVLAQLQKAGCRLDLQDPHLHEVKNEIMNISKQIREKIACEVKDQFLSLLVDIVTKRGRSIFGASIQYINNKNVKVRSIGMMELNESHTGIYLANLIIERLKVINVDLKQIVTITTDNGSNVLKMVRDVHSHLQSAVEESRQQVTSLQNTPNRNNETLHDIVNEEATDLEIDDLLSAEDDLTDGQAISLILQAAEIEDDEPTNLELHANQNLLKAMQSNMANDCGSNVVWNVTGINCIVHTLQLAISDSIEALQKSVKNLISLCRRVAKHLRLASTEREFKLQGINFKRPRIDVVTRWGSLYQMVNFPFFNM